MTPEELERKVRREAEAQIKVLVAGYQSSERKSIEEIETAALRLGQELGEAALKAMVAARPAEESIRVCPTCGGRVHAKGQRSKWVQTRAGEVQLKRDYYYWESCGTGFFPQ